MTKAASARAQMESDATSDTQARDALVRAQGDEKRAQDVLMQAQAAFNEAQVDFNDVQATLARAQAALAQAQAAVTGAGTTVTGVKAHAAQQGALLARSTSAHVAARTTVSTALSTGRPA